MICEKRSRRGWQRLQPKKPAGMLLRPERLWGGVGACVEEEMLWDGELGGQELGLPVEFLGLHLKLYVC